MRRLTERRGNTLEQYHNPYRSNLAIGTIFALIAYISVFMASVTGFCFVAFLLTARSELSASTSRPIAPPSPIFVVSHEQLGELVGTLIAATVQSYTPTPFHTATPRPTPSPSSTWTAIPTRTPTWTPTITNTATPFYTPTPWPTPIPSDTMTPIPTWTSLPTNTPTLSLTVTDTATPFHTSTPFPTDTPIAPTATLACHPSYPDFCIPPSPPDLNCDDIPQENFTVLHPGDPHGFDREKDGRGCE